MYIHQKISLRKFGTGYIEISVSSIWLTATSVKKYGLTMMTSIDDQVKAYIKKIMSQLSKWMQRSKISKLVVVITSKETGEHVERWQFDVRLSLIRICHKLLFLEPAEGQAR